jgi:hypothetical protein
VGDEPDAVNGTAVDDLKHPLGTTMDGLCPRSATRVLDYRMV